MKRQTSLRHVFKQCEMLRGDKEGPREHCQNFATTTAFWNGTRLRVCEPHREILKFHQQRVELNAKEIKVG